MKIMAGCGINGENLGGKRGGENVLARRKISKISGGVMTAKKLSSHQWRRKRAAIGGGG